LSRAHVGDLFSLNILTLCRYSQESGYYHAPDVAEISSNLGSTLMLVIDTDTERSFKSLS
jgi:hypothetical protein